MVTATLLKLSMIMFLTVWVCLWFLKPTELWTKSWHSAEDTGQKTVLGYFGLGFIVFSFPIIAVAILGSIYIHLNSKQRRTRNGMISFVCLSNPIIIRSPLGMIYGLELITVIIFMAFLAWTYYARISKDFKKVIPVKSIKLNISQLKVMRLGIRCGSLAEACLALLLLPVLRGIPLFRLLRLQLENSVRYHIWLGNAMMMFAILHGFAIMSIWGVTNNIRNQISQWQKTGRVNLAGEITLVAGLIIWITSLPFIRRKKFELFYYTHHLYMLFIAFFLLHAGDRHFYMIFSGVILFSLDKLLRIIQSRRSTCLISASLLPCNAIELTIPKHPTMKYTPTSIIFIKIPSISNSEWHPFSITSSSNVEKKTMSVMIKCQGHWTNALYNTIHAAALSTEASHMKCLPVAIEGPYGPVSFDFLRYDSLILVAGGSGITPLLSIFHEVCSRNNSENMFSTRIQLIYVVKKSQDLSMLNSILPLLLKQSTEQGYLKLKIFVTGEERSSSTTKELLLEISQPKTVYFDTQCSNYIAPRPESSLWIATILGVFCVIFLVSLGFLNHFLLHSEKKSSAKKNPSWASDLVVVCSFFIALVSSISATVLLRWRRTKKETLSVSHEKAKGTQPSSKEGGATLVEHDVYFGERPNFQDIFSKFPVQVGESNIGVMVCGPESMQKAVASSCCQYSPSFNLGGNKRKKPFFSFHSLNFTL